MTQELSIGNFFYEIWIQHFPLILLSNLILYLIFLKINVNSLIDFGWSLNYLINGLIFFYKRHSVLGYQSYFILFLLVVWFVKLGGFLFVTRVLKGLNDKRYEKMRQVAVTHRKYWFLFQYIFQGELTSYSLNDLCCSFILCFQKG